MKCAILLAFVTLGVSGCASDSATSTSIPQYPHQPTATLSATPTRVNISHSTVFEWQTTNTTRADITSVGSVAPNGSLSVTPTKTSIYTLTANGTGGTQTASVNITVLPNMDCWGDSLASGDGGFGTGVASTLAQLSGANVFNGGRGGDTSTQAAARMLAAPDKFGDVIVVWVGHNDISNPTQVLSDITTMVNALTVPRRFLVLSLLNATSKPSGTSAYQQVMDMNASLQNAFPDNFLDVRTLLITNGLSFEGITPTSKDLADIAVDGGPCFRRSDGANQCATSWACNGLSPIQWKK